MFLQEELSTERDVTRILREHHDELATQLDVKNLAVESIRVDIQTVVLEQREEAKKAAARDCEACAAEEEQLGGSLLQAGTSLLRVQALVPEASETLAQIQVELETLIGDAIEKRQGLQEVRESEVGLAEAALDSTKL